MVAKRDQAKVSDVTVLESGCNSLIEGIVFANQLKRIV